jgi:repressor of nif and glnA expression
MTGKEHSNQESFKVSGDELLSKIKEIIKEGNARRVIIKNEKEETIMEFPLTIGAIGVVLAPMFAAIGAIAALATDCTIVVEKREMQEK